MHRFHLPLARRGQRIGLLGGSFDPAHEGHLHISKIALKRFDLDQVWWLVSPGNPLKEHGPASLELRMKTARNLADHPRIHVTDIERQFATRFTAATLHKLIPRYPCTRFVWLMGADNLAGFHHWRDWPSIFRMLPIGVIARPGDRLSAPTSPAARRFRDARISGKQSRLLALSRAPAWCYVNAPLNRQSSSALRAAGRWPA